MIRYSSDVTIDRPPSAVFAALLDPDLYAKWMPMTDMSFEDAGPIAGRPEGPVTTWPKVRSRACSTWRSSSWNQTAGSPIGSPSRRSSGRAVTSLRPDGAGTHVTYAGEMSLRGWRRILEPIMGGEVSKGEATEIRRFKALLEGDAAGNSRTGDLTFESLQG